MKSSGGAYWNNSRLLFVQRKTIKRRPHKECSKHAAGGANQRFGHSSAPCFEYASEYS